MAETHIPFDEARVRAQIADLIGRYDIVPAGVLGQLIAENESQAALIAEVKRAVDFEPSRLTPMSVLMANALSDVIAALTRYESEGPK